MGGKGVRETQEHVPHHRHEAESEQCQADRKGRWREFCDDSENEDPARPGRSHPC